MTETLTTLVLIAVGLLHLLPVAGVLGARQLDRLYGVSTASPSMQLLLRHRAALFGIVGGLLLLAAADHALRPVAFAVGGFSLASYLLLAALTPGYNAHLGRVVVIDQVALGALFGVWLLGRF